MNKKSKEAGLPIQYRIEIYEDSFENDPCASWEASTPFLAVNVGDYIDPRVWTEGQLYEPVKPNETLRVTATQHLLWTIRNSHIGHSLSVCVKKTRRPSAK